MKYLQISITSMLGIFLATAATAVPQGDQGDAPSPGLLDSVVNFRLFDHAGGSHELLRNSDAKAVVLYTVAADSKAVPADTEKLNALAEAYRDQGIRFFMLNGAGDSRAEAAKAAEAWQASMPILLDSTQLIAEALGATHAGEAIVVNPSNWSMAYRGHVDGLDSALQAVLAGEPVDTPVTAASGEAFTFPARSSELTFVEHAAPILQAKCVECHSEGGIGPFAMDSYRKVQGFAPMIREVILAKRMPPWHADPHFGEFANDKSLTPDETRTLVTWIEAGAPRGEGADPLRAAAAENKSEWTLGEPDLVVTMEQPEHLTASGVFDYRYQEVLVPVEEDKWVKGVEVRPGNKQVLHHALMFLRYPEHLSHMQPDWNGGVDGYFAGYVPGMLPMFYPENSGKFLPKGSTVVFQMHYTATGKPETDQTSLGFYFHDEKPEFEYSTRGASFRDFVIEPGDRNAEARAIFRLSEDVLFWGMNPHMHLRGSRFKYTARYPDGDEEVLLSVPHYDFNWQTDYRLADAKKLPAGTRIICEGAFDNSATNPANPDPNKHVRWGDQSFEEMFIGFMNYIPLGTKTEVETAARTIDGPITEESIVGTEWKFMQFKLFFDKDGLLLVNDSINGTWEWNGDTLTVDVAGRRLDIDVNGQELSLRGQRLVPWT